jgi:hypothetical protein
MEDELFLSLALTISGNIFENPWGSYLFYFDTTEDGLGADIDVDRRPISVADPYQPEFRLDIQALDRKGTVSGTFVFNVWNGVDWETSPITFGIALNNGTPSIMEIQIPKSLLGNPEFVNLSVVSTGRGRVHTAGDILGTDYSPDDWAEPIILDQFTKFELTK